jgi:hypothetical protein
MVFRPAEVTAKRNPAIEIGNGLKVLMVLTSHDQLGHPGRKTGFWLEELAAPYHVFKGAGAEIVLASPKGGQPPLDPKSNEPNSVTRPARFATSRLRTVSRWWKVKRSLDSLTPKGRRWA